MRIWRRLQADFFAHLNHLSNVKFFKLLNLTSEASATTGAFYFFNQAQSTPKGFNICYPRPVRHQF